MRVSCCRFADRATGASKSTWRPRGTAAERTEASIASSIAPGRTTRSRARPSRCGAAWCNAACAFADPLGLGLRTGPRGAVIDADGWPGPHLFYVGPMLRADLWEATAATSCACMRSAWQRCWRPSALDFENVIFTRASRVTIEPCECSATGTGGGRHGQSARPCSRSARSACSTRCAGCYAKSAMRRSSQQIAAQPASDLLLAGLATALSYLVLTGYDFSALKYAGAQVRSTTVLLTSFIAYALGNTVGLGVLTGGAVRMRLYTAAGIDAGRVAQAAAFNAGAFVIGMIAFGAAGLLWGAHQMSPSWLDCRAGSCARSPSAAAWRRRADHRSGGAQS